MDVSSFFKYTNTRVDQLKKEAIIDNKLNDICYKKCPDILSLYLLSNYF